MPDEEPLPILEGSGTPAPGTPGAGRPAPGLGRMLEDSLLAPFRPGPILGDLASAAAPSYGLLAANVALFSGLFLAVNVVHAWLVFPALMAHGPFWLLFGGAWLLLAAVLASFAAAGVLHVLSRILGGQGSLRRTYQIVSVGSGLVAYQAVLNWFPAFWPLTFIAAGVIAAAGLVRVHGIPARPAWAAAAALCALSIGTVELGLRAVRGELLKEIAGIPDGPPTLPETEPPAAPSPESPAPLPPSSLPIAASGPAAPLSPQGLPAAPALPTAPGQAPSPQQLDAMLAGPLAMMNQALADPAMTKGMPPEQAKQLRELMAMLGEMQASLKSGKPMTEVQKAKVLKFAAQANAQFTQALQAAPRAKPKGRADP